MAESEEEVDVLVQRVVKDINNAFKRNPNIRRENIVQPPVCNLRRQWLANWLLTSSNPPAPGAASSRSVPCPSGFITLFSYDRGESDEIGLIPCPEARYNRSPIVLVENKLGVESWKELLQCGVLNPEKDLYLGKLALSKHPKSPETWIHRRWVLQWLQKECSPSGQELKDQAEPRGDAVRRRPCERMQRALQEEMKVCADAAGRYPSNYNAWSHRIWVLQNMAKGNLKVLHDELSSTRLWVSMHVSDHSGFHYRQHLLKALARELSQVGETELHPTQQPNGESTAGASDDNHHNDVIPPLFHEEMELCTDLIESYPGHETLWCHRRHVFYLWHQWRREHLQGAGSQSPPLTHTDVLLSEEPCDDSSASQAMDVDCVLDGSKHGSYTQDTKRLKRGPLLPHPGLPSEHTFVSKILTGCRSPEQSRFAIAYRKWLDSVIGQ
ncbi:prenyltransferase alpha subunit repeat-containing 1 [Labeo rohita]|uniref:Prenyltransferase alpha subunit repeat-containing 1 n=1 Tax=Labeo rohita TaxID=84645 RepID=A0A498MQM8_LABRO|nr:prenyltransferase alpha subunit repeat-containing 1 [Labeo rohita]